jgi:asparagine synthetase B (glutamine-hydrolysing)
VDCIFASVGPTGTLFEALCREAAANGAQVRSAAVGHLHLGAASTGGEAVAFDDTDGRIAAAFGSGVRHAGASRALEGGVPHTVAVRVGDTTPDRHLVAIAGPGDHLLFRHVTPEGGTVVCSQLGVLARALGPSLRLDRSREDVLLGNGFLPDGRTVYVGIDALPPGTATVLGAHDLDPADRGAGTDTSDGGGNGGMRSTTPAPAATSPTADTPPPPANFDAAVEGLHDRFLAAVEEQAGPDRRHAVLLGGIDSALVAACLRRLGHEVHTYTFSFGDTRFEQRNVQALATATGTIPHAVPITADVIMDGLEAFGAVFAQPGPQPHYQVHTLAACRQLRADGFTHVFSGDGADAVLLGYPNVVLRSRIAERLGRVPQPVRGATQRVLATRLAERRLGYVARATRGGLAVRALPAPADGHLPLPVLDAAALARLRTTPTPPQAESVAAVRARLAGGLVGLDPVRLAFDGNAAVGQSRVKVDGAVAATGVAQSSPFRHPEVVRFVGSMPQHFLRGDGEAATSPGKAVMVAMVRRHGLLPDAVIDQPKQSPVDAPIDAWYAGELRPRLEALLDRLPFGWDRRWLDDVLAPKWVEERYRQRVSLAHHTFQVVGMLASYASFCAVAEPELDVTRPGGGR